MESQELVGRKYVDCLLLACCRVDHLHPPVECVLALGSEEINVSLELKFEDVILVDFIGMGRRCDGVTK